MTDAGTAGSPIPPVPGSAAARRATRSRWMLVALIVVCVAPVIASYLAYYVFPPAERTNYGELIEPQRPVPSFRTLVIQAGVVTGESPPVAAPTAAALAEQGFGALGGRWILAAVDSGSCDVACAEKLFFMRQTHVAMGRERGRMTRVLLVTDATPLSPALLAAHPDMTVLRIDPAEVEPLFPVGSGGRLAGHVFVVDPLRNLMMRFPEAPDPAKTRKDLRKLLKASRIG